MHVVLRVFFCGALAGWIRGVHLVCASVQVSSIQISMVTCQCDFTAPSSFYLLLSQQADDGYHDSTSKALTLDLEK